MTLSDPSNPGFNFQGLGILTSQISKKKRCVLGTKLLKNTTRKEPHIPNGTYNFQWPRVSWPRFQGHDIFSTLNTSETTRGRSSHSYYRTSIGSRMRSIEWWYFHWPWPTLIRGFQSQGIFEVEYLKYRAFYGQSFYRTLIGNYTQSIEWYHFQWPWVTSDPDFKVTTFFEVELFTEPFTACTVWPGVCSAVTFLLEVVVVCDLPSGTRSTE